MSSCKHYDCPCGRVTTGKQVSITKANQIKSSTDVKFRCWNFIHSCHFSFIPLIPLRVIMWPGAVDQLSSINLRFHINLPSKTCQTNWHPNIPVQNQLGTVARTWVHSHYCTHTVTPEYKDPPVFS